MKDQLVKAMALDQKVRFYINRATDLVQEAKDRFELENGPADALGRVLCVASILGSMLKSEKEMLTINITGQGPLNSIIVDAYPNGNVRGFLSNPHPEQSNLPVAELVGLPGTLTVIKDLSMQENWSGMVELQNGEIAQDFAYYFTLSEQTPTAVSIGVRINEEGKVLAAGALVLQMMPDATNTEISVCEHVLSGLKPMSTLIEDYDDTNLDELAKDLFDDTEVLETLPIKFSCTCTKEKTASVLATMNPKELRAMIEEDHGAEVVCSFCNEKYHFDEEDLKQVLNRIENNLEESKELEEQIPEDSRD